MAVDLLITYKAEVDQLISELNLIIAKQEQITDEQKSGQQAINKNLTSQQVAAEKRLALLKLEEAELKKLQQLKKLAYDPKVISDYNKKIAESQKNIQLLGGSIKKTASESSLALKSFATGITQALGAAFSIDAIIRFGQASINAFLEAQENAEKLRFTITQVGGESEAAFQRLIDQSTQLQNITIFSDDSVQQAQNALATFGLTADQIEDLIPKLADFASATKRSIQDAAQAVGAGLQGQGKEFKKYGIEVSAAASELDNLNAITEGFVRFQGQAAEETKTLTGQLKQQQNAADELQEAIGSKLAPAWVEVKLAVFEATLAVIDYFDAGIAGVAGNKFLREAEKQGTAYDEIAKKIADLTKVNTDYGLSAEDARQKSVNAIRAEILARLDLAKANQASQESLGGSEFDQKRAKLRVDAVRNELTALNQLIEGDKRRAEAAKALIPIEELRLKQTEELNKLLTENERNNDLFSKKNVLNIKIELEARKKAADEAKKAANVRDQSLDFETKKVDGLTANYNDLVKVFTELDKLKALGLDINVLTDPEELKEQVAKLVVEAQNELDKDPLIITTRSDLPTVMADGIEEVLITNEMILDATASMLNDLNGLYNAFANQRITSIQDTTNTEIENLDKQLAANDEALKNRRITEREAANEKIEIEAEKVKAEQEADKKIRAIKRQQAIINKIAALAEIALATARNIVEQPGPLGALIPYWVAIGAAQAAIAAAQPIPYKKGSKNTKEGLARVGEEGEEIVFMPGGSKVLPAGKTQTYGAALDAMFDNRFDKWVIDNYAPKLIAQQKQHKESESKSYAKNIADSLTVNVASAPMNRRKDRVTMDNIEELAEAIVRSSFQSPYRR